MQPGMFWKLSRGRPWNPILHCREVAELRQLPGRSPCGASHTIPVPCPLYEQDTSLAGLRSPVWSRLHYMYLCGLGQTTSLPYDSVSPSAKWNENNWPHTIGCESEHNPLPGDLGLPGTTALHLLLSRPTPATRPPGCPLPRPPGLHPGGPSAERACRRDLNSSRAAFTNRPRAAATLWLWAPTQLSCLGPTPAPYHSMPASAGHTPGAQ